MNKFFTFFIAFSFTSCVFVEKYNAHIKEEISADDLKKDVDQAKKRLLTKHVDIDLYHSKQVIENRLDSFKNSISSPMKPNDFSRELSKVVSSFGHGHTVVFGLSRRMTKEERKKFKNSKDPFSLMELKSFDNHLYIDNTFSKDSTLPKNTEIVAINGVKYKDVYDENRDYRKADGYITTLDKYIQVSPFVRKIKNDFGPQDSIAITFKKNDSVYTQILKREYTKRHVKTNGVGVKKDSISKNKTQKPVVVKLTKERKNCKKQLNQHKVDVKKYFAYNKAINDYQRKLIFPDKNDSTTVILQVKSFAIGHGKKAYPFIFDSILKLNVKNLILDVRNNGGGFATDANYLYSFLTKNNYPQMVMADEMKVNSRFSVTKNHIKSSGLIGNTLGLPFALYNYARTTLRISKSKEGNYYYKFKNKRNLLNQPKKYEGNLYVLTNGMSYSATSVLSAALQNEGKAVFVGEETGGDYNGTVAGSFEVYQLKYSKIGINYGLLDFKPNTSRQLKGRGIIPNVPIDMRFEDIMHKKDPQLDWILNDIKANK